MDPEAYTTSNPKTRSRINKLLKEGEKTAEPKKGCGCVTKCPHTISQSQGEHVITMVRESFFIQQPLPYPIWGQLYLQGNFQTILQQYLNLIPGPPITVTQSINSAGNLVLTYTNGIETDTIVIGVPSIGLIAYSEILSGLKTNYWRSCYMLFNCNAGTITNTYDNAIIYGIQKLGLFLQAVGGTGNKDAQLIIPFNRQSINNSVINITEIYLRNEPIKPDSVWVHSFPWLDFAGMGLPNRPLEYNFTVFISEVVDMNAAKI